MNELPSDAPFIPEYRLLRHIGAGGYGDVWLAQGVTGLYRAIKIVRRDRFHSPGPYEREFKGLIQFASVSIAEPSQLALLHIGRNDAAGFFYYVMEAADDARTGVHINPERYVPRTLKFVHECHRRLPFHAVLELAIDLARALAGLHARGLVHRDIKPSNVIYARGAPKLADIGLVSAAAGAHTFVGTAGFIPPEGPGSPSADVFSLGRLLYVVATGFDRQDFPRLPPELVRSSSSGPLLELNEILMKACDPAPGRRYPSARELLGDLELLREGRSLRRRSATLRQIRLAGRAAAIVAGIAGIAGTAVAFDRALRGERSVVQRTVDSRGRELPE